jgi:nicotinate-nucleotide pyrophosphorylase
MAYAYRYLLPPLWRETVRAYLRDDAPTFDVGGFVVGAAPREARLLCKQPGRTVLCGAPFVEAVFEELGCAVEWQPGFAYEGAEVDNGAAGAPTCVAGSSGSPIVIRRVRAARRSRNASWIDSRTNTRVPLVQTSPCV